MTPASAIYFGLILFFMLPLTILLVGAVLSYFKPNHRKAMGTLLIVLGSVELSLWLVVTKTLSFSGVLIYIVTIATGIVSLLFAYKVLKN
jgi:hypothetical protein